MPIQTRKPRHKSARKSAGRLVRPVLLGGTRIDINHARFDFDSPMIFQSNAYSCFAAGLPVPVAQSADRRALTVATAGPSLTVGMTFIFTPDPGKVLGANGMTPIAAMIALK